MNSTIKIIIASLLLLLAACKKETDNPKPQEDPMLILSPTTNAITFGARAEESYIYRVTTNSPAWTAESDREWCIVAVDAEAGTFTVTALPNDASAAPEPASITVKAGEAPSLTISATQLGAEYELFISGEYTIGDDIKTEACYWKNGVREMLPYPAEVGDKSQSISIASSNGKVYIVGHIGGIACYWENGKFVKLPEYRSPYLTPLSIALDNGSVYVLSALCYWKDLEIVPLDESDLIPNSIAVSNGSVSVFGHLSKRYNAACWTNGQVYPLDLPVDLPADILTSQVRCATASDGSVYAGGYYSDVHGLEIPCYWKDGECTSFELPQDAKFGRVDAIFVDNGTVYAAGRCSGPNVIYNCYWVNGKRTDLESPFEILEYKMTGITAMGGKVYVSGYFGYNLEACYWIDGKRTDLPKEANMTGIRTSGIALVKK